jgi:hypothetical protein
LSGKGINPILSGKRAEMNYFEVYYDAESHSTFPE